MFNGKMNWKFLLRQSKAHQIPATNCIALLDLDDYCLRHIGQFLSAEDAYSFGHTCTKLLEIMSKLRLHITIKSSNDFKYLNYFKAEARDLTIDTGTNNRAFTEVDQMILLFLLEKCTKIRSLNLCSLNSRILSSEFFKNIAHQLVHLKISLMEPSKICWTKFISSMEKCENLTSLHIEYDEENVNYTSDHLVELFSIEFPALKVFRFDSECHYFNYPGAFVPLDIFLLRNSQLKTVEITAPLFGEYLKAVILCPQLERFTFRQDRIIIDEDLMAKMLDLNKLPVLTYTSLRFPLQFVNYAVNNIVEILQQIQSLRELTLECTLSEDIIQDVVRIPQLTSLNLIVEQPYIETNLLEDLTDTFFSRDGFPKAVELLQFHEQNLRKLTNLDLSDFSHCRTITSNCLTQFIKFIINCPQIESIEFNSLFPIDTFYKRLLNYKKKFGHHAREKTLRLKIPIIQWIPGYAGGRRTHNIAIQDYNGDEPSISLCNILTYGRETILRSAYYLLSIYFCVGSVYCVPIICKNIFIFMYNLSNKQS